MSQNRVRASQSVASLTLGAVVLSLLTSAALAQGSAKPDATPAPAAGKVDASGFRSSGNPLRDTLLRMQRPVSATFNEERLEKVMDFLRDSTGANIEILWKTDKEEGLDREMSITLTVKDEPAIDVLDRVLRKITADSNDDCSWQMTPAGAMQIGTKARLNKYKRIEIYDINDLLFVMPIYNQSPEIDLNQALQSNRGGGGGGGGSSPFKDSNSNRNQNQAKESKDERATEIQQLIVGLVEEGQWKDSGGEGGSIKYYQGHFIVNAADYMHRALVGYAWWPQSRAAQGVTRRYVTSNTDAGSSSVQSVGTAPAGGAVR